MLQIRDEILAIPYVGPQVAKTLNKLDIKTVEDLAYYFPRAWEDLTDLSPIAELKDDGEKHTIRATLVSSKSFRSPRKRMHLTQGLLRDDTDDIAVIWFNQPYLKTTLKAGQEYYFTGKISARQDQRTLVSPTFELADRTPLHSGKIVSIYPETKGLSSRMLRRIIKNILPAIRELEDFLPDSIRKQHQFYALPNAIESIHLPNSVEDLQAAKDRLAFDELFVTQVAIAQLKAALKDQPANPIPMDVALIKQIIGELPFTLTAAQKQALHEILKDLELNQPMNRLLMGDVGSGKTIVAAIAMMQTARTGLRSVFMAPTEVLATQQYRSLKPLLDKFKISLALKTREFEEGDLSADIIIGTHALIQLDIDIKNLGLVIIDEQHRFGVHQREALKSKGQIPHLLTLTATPIPRSLALSIFGDLDISLIPVKPKDRKPIITEALDILDRDQAYKRIAQEIANKHQAFIVAPLVAASSKLDTKSAEAIYQEVKKRFPKARVELLHGRLSGDQKESVFTKFKNGQADILVATTVIEVGVDVPNATVMLIEGAERFGLSQLHQLRGRVGRDAAQSYCFVIPSHKDDPTLERLTLFSKYQDGAKLAELDLKLRGPGSLFGYAQSGFLKYKLADWTDAAAIKRAREAATNLIAQDPTLADHPQLASRINTEKTTIHSE